MLDERVLIKRCLADDRVAITELYQRYSGVLYAICLRYTSGREDANDLLHDGFIRILQKMSEFRFEGSFEGWLKRVMVTMAINFYRKQKKSTSVQLDLLAPLEDDAPDVLDSLSAEYLVSVISELPDGYKQVFNLFAIEGYKHKEIAEMLGITESTSKTQYFKAKKWLVAALLQKNPELNHLNQPVHDEQ